MRKSVIAGLIAAALGSLLAWADGINIPFVFPASTCTNQFIRSIAASTGVGTCASIAAGDFPALTGDVTTAGGSLATTLAAGSASNLNSGTLPAARLPFNGATLAANPSNPTGTTDTATGKMMGLGSTCTITPANSTRIVVSVSGNVSNDTTGDGVFARIHTGTGTAPTNGAASAGTARTQNGSATLLTAAPLVPWAQTWTVTGLTPGTAVWIDLLLGAVTGGTATIRNVNCSAVEM